MGRGPLPEPMSVEAKDGGGDSAPVTEVRCGMEV